MHCSSEKDVIKAVENCRNFTMANNLTHLSLTCMGNDLEDFFQSLQSNHTLLFLSLYCNKNVGDNGAQFISKYLQSNSTLIELQLGDNNISDKGVEVISKSLQSNFTLTGFSFSGF
eukprot:TRINITY_DN13590_c0_g2_i1.p1 TRINITY_DN13590_c0_g2~~TRINITY_DN13590_c0_g2_i1.p1  ORF type:complete len:116 (+),score=25.77 TRINITY_DN13590_c0_g2_i1:128-475(+)